ncbi:MAG: family 43 glycosylhydrolase [Planctomycetes bacterium]|nr:family 43 glycosylhydrolase [Planctomycetota bacterium]
MKSRNQKARVMGALCCLGSLMAAVSCASCAAEGKPATATYTNPILTKDARGGADPAVILHEGVYYYYSTNPGLNVFTSSDLVHWTKGPQVLPDEFKGVWAPEVYRHPEDGKFYMVYTRRYKIGVAVADRPDAMFKDLGYLAIPGIDAHLFRDDDGRLYLYFTNTPSFTMYCVPMKSPTETGGPVTKCFEISQDWEKHSFAINEGPWMLKHDGRYYLLYSGSDGQSIYYAIGYATAPTPIGPFTKYEKNPVFQDLPSINGPGHGSVIRDRAGQLWHLYHQKTGTEKGWSRDICLDPVAFDERGVFGGTPTRGVAQTVPACNPSLVWSPDICPRGAVFNKQVTVSLSSHTPGAQIRYTLNGTEPDESSPLYEKPFTLTASATVKARAFKDGMTTSAVASMRFTQTDEPLPENPSPNAPAGNPPFEVFPKANPNWQPPKKN